MGSSGLLDQSGSLYPGKNHLYECEVDQDIYVQDRMSAWSSEDYRIGQRNIVYFKVLASVTPDLGYKIGVQYNLPPTD